MPKINKMPKTFSFLKFSIILIFFINFIFISIFFITCQAPKPEFENIQISSKIEKDTNTPVDVKNKFDITTKEIFATVNYFGVKGDDKWKFKWINLETGKTILENEGKFNQDTNNQDTNNQNNQKNSNSYFKGTVISSIRAPEEAKIIPPAKYKVEFYYNSTLQKSATFEISKPTVEILEASLASSIDEKNKPIKVKENFSLNDTVFLCLKINYLIEGNNIKVIWEDKQDKILKQEEYVISSNYYNQTYIKFSLNLKEYMGAFDLREDLEKLNVKVYLNNNLYKTIAFNVEKTSLVTFIQNIFYSNDDFKFKISIPDNWTYEERKSKDSVTINILPPEKINANFAFKVMPAKTIKPYEIFTKLDADYYAEQNDWKFINSSYREYSFNGKYDASEFVYLYEDVSSTNVNSTINYAIVYNIIEKDNYAYIFSVISDNSKDTEIAQQAYIGILNSLVYY